MTEKGAFYDSETEESPFVRLNALRLALQMLGPDGQKGILMCQVVQENLSLLSHICSVSVPWEMRDHLQNCPICRAIYKAS